MSILKKISLLALMTLTSFSAVALPLAALADPLWVGRFSERNTTIPDPWKIEHLDRRVPPTQYGLRKWDGVFAIEAKAKKSMALLGRPLAVDLKKTPVLCWQWRIDATVASADMSRKSGDDYAARVYLTFEVPAEQLGFSTRTKLRLARSINGDQVPDAALNYIWDNRHPVGTLQDNAYTDRARMLVLRSGNTRAGRWVQERRNVLVDFRRAFGEIVGELRGLAIASDTDNTGEEAHAGFADFRFVETEEACPAAERDGGLSWSSDRVMAQTRARLHQMNWRWSELPPPWDVDREEDFKRLVKLFPDASLVRHDGLVLA